MARHLSKHIGGYLVCVALAGFLFLSDTLNTPELLWLDTSFRVLRSISPLPAGDDSLVVVGLDDASLEMFHVPVATLHRQLGAFFEAMSIAQPKAVGIDIVLPEKSFDDIQPGLDLALIKGLVPLQRTAPLVLGVGALPDGSPRPINGVFTRFVGEHGLGSVFVLKDPDGTYRRFDERIGDAEQSIPTLAGQLARNLDIPVSTGILPWHTLGPIEYVPLHEALAWHANRDIEQLRAKFGNKIVLLGSLLAHDDLHRVPVHIQSDRDNRNFPGVFIHAYQVHSLATQTLVRDLPQYIVLLVGMLMAVSWFLDPIRSRWVFVGFLTASVFIGSVFLLNAGIAMPAIFLSSCLVGPFVARTSIKVLQVAAERRILRRAFGGFVSPAVLKEILSGRLTPALSGEKREICVLFSDIRGFTSLSECMDPEATTRLLNLYFERMSSVIHRYDGTLDKYLGDGIMAFFGAPQMLDNPCRHAFSAAKDMMKELASLNDELQREGSPSLQIGIGLHFGPAVVGYIGAKDRNEYTAIGDTVNLASRLEEMTKELGWPVVCSSTVAMRLDGIDVIATLGEHPIKGHTAIAMFGWKPVGANQ